MLGGLLFVVCVILQFHYHDPIPWYIWVLALIALFVSGANQQCDLLLGKRTECARGWLDAGSAVLHCALGT